MEKTLRRKLSVIIISRNRPHSLRRAVDYWRNVAVSLIVIDGSDQTQFSWMELYKGDDFLYFHEKSDFTKRLKIASDFIETPYSIFISDDEFYIQSALLECVNFLEDNKDYVAVNGRSVGFSKIEGVIVGTPIYPEWAGRIRVEPDPKNRLIAHMGSYCCSLTFSVTRTDLWQMVADLYYAYEFPIFALWELESSIILSFSGKSKTLNTLMHMRSLGENEPIRNDIPSLTTANSIVSWWRSSQFDSQKIHFIDLISSRLKTAVEGFDDDYYRESIAGAIDAYCGWIDEKQSNLSFGWIRRNFISHIPHALKVYIKKVLFLCLNQGVVQNREPLLGAVKRLEKDGVFIDYAELESVQKQILFFETINP